jgi:hypothetical protein
VQKKNGYHPEMRIYWMAIEQQAALEFFPTPAPGATNMLQEKQKDCAGMGAEALQSGK